MFTGTLWFWLPAASIRCRPCSALQKWFERRLLFERTEVELCDCRAHLFLAEPGLTIASRPAYKPAVPQRTRLASKP
jgi:hypothetical protein